MCEHGFVLPAAAVTEFQNLYLVFRAGYNRLSADALARSVCRWPLRPKQHYFEHMVLDTAPFNGRMMHNYLSEDFMRRIKALSVGSHPAHLSRHVIIKYALQCCLRWR